MNIAIPITFFYKTYKGSAHPQNMQEESEREANCQKFAYDLLRYFGFSIPPFRSDELWEDQEYTQTVNTANPLDLILFNHSSDSYGSHIGVYLGEDKVLHLCKEVGYPTVWDMTEFKKRERYSVIVGIKHPLKRNR